MFSGLGGTREWACSIEILQVGTARLLDVESDQLLDRRSHTVSLKICQQSTGDTGDSSLLCSTYPFLLYSDTQLEKASWSNA